MHRLSKIALWASIAIGLGFCALDIWPFVAGDMLFFMFILVIVGPLALFLIFILVDLVGTIRKRREVLRLIIGRYALCLIIVGGSLFLAATCTLRNLAFKACMPQFTEMCKTLPDDQPAPFCSRGEKTTIVGPWIVDAARHPSGGVFFRIGSYMSGFDRISYGFAYKPNKHGTPFGAARYELEEIAPDWYEFSVSSDWY